MKINEASRRAGLSTKTIRYYEAAGLLPPPKRNEAGYREFTEGDVARLQLIRRAKLLGLSLAAAQALADRAFAADCADFGDELMRTLADQRATIERRIAELTALRGELEVLEDHIRHNCAGCEPDCLARECHYCGLITLEEGGEPR